MPVYRDLASFVTPEEIVSKHLQCSERFINNPNALIEG